LIFRALEGHSCGQVLALRRDGALATFHKRVRNHVSLADVTYRTPANTASTSFSRAAKLRWLYLAAMAGVLWFNRLMICKLLAPKMQKARRCGPLFAQHLSGFLATCCAEASQSQAQQD